MPTLTGILDAIAHPRILVIGDLILDRYTFGDAERVSPEAPVLVLRVESREVRLGGAASVAMLLRALEAEVTLAGVIGDDPEGRTLLKLLDDEQIDRSMVLTDSTRPTTVKERFVGNCPNRSAAGGQQMLRVDQETRAPIDARFEEWLFLETATRLEYPWGRVRRSETGVRAAPGRLGIDWIAPTRPSEEAFSRTDMSLLYSHISYDAVLISDYAKGACTEGLVQMILAKAGERRVPVIIDPARIADYDRYRYATLLKPNRFEAELATGRQIVTPDAAVAAGETLRQKFKVESVLITLDRDGMALVEAAACGSTSPGGLPSSSFDPSSSSSLHLPTTPREVYDITGAGDMVLATLGLCLASQIPLPKAAQLANIAAGLEVEKLGVTPITREELSHALPPFENARQTVFPPLESEGQGGALGMPASLNCANDALTNSGVDTPSSPSLNPKSFCKLTTLPALLGVLQMYREAGKRIAFTNGCFDLLHVGHITCLEQAAVLGDILIVAVNSDASVRKLKGPDRPIIPERDRAQMLAALNCVDYVLIFDDATPHKILEQIRPDTLAKGGTTAEIIGQEVVESYGGRVVHVGHFPGISTTALLSAFPGREGFEGGRYIPPVFDNTGNKLSGYGQKKGSAGAHCQPTCTTKTDGEHIATSIPN